MGLQDDRDISQVVDVLSAPTLGLRVLELWTDFTVDHHGMSRHSYMPRAPPTLHMSLPETLSALPSLRSVKLEDISIDWDLIAFRGLKTLEIVFAVGTQSHHSLTTAGLVRVLSDLPDLRILTLRRCVEITGSVPSPTRTIDSFISNDCPLQAPLLNATPF
jgi:hypothetical protein